MAWIFSKVFLPALIIMAMFFTSGTVKTETEQTVIVTANPAELYSEGDAVDAETGAALLARLGEINNPAALLASRGSIRRIDTDGSATVELRLFDSPLGTVFAYLSESYDIYEVGDRAYVKGGDETLVTDASQIDAIYGMNPENLLFVYSESEVCVARRSDGDSDWLLTHVADENGDMQIEYLLDGDMLIIGMRCYILDSQSGDYMLAYTDEITYGEQFELPDWVGDLMSDDTASTDDIPEGYAASDAVSGDEAYSVMSDMDARNIETEALELYGSITTTVSVGEYSVTAAIFDTPMGACTYLNDGVHDIYELDGRTYYMEGNRSESLEQSMLTDDYGLAVDDFLNTYNADEICLYKRIDGDLTYILSQSGEEMRYEYILDSDMRIVGIKVFALQSDDSYSLVSEEKVEYGAEIELPDWVFENMPIE